MLENITFNLDVPKWNPFDVDVNWSSWKPHKPKIFRLMALKGRYLEGRIWLFTLEMEERTLLQILSPKGIFIGFPSWA